MRRINLWGLGRLLIVVAVITLVSGLTGCGGSSRQPEDPTAILQQKTSLNETVNDRNQEPKPLSSQTKYRFTAKPSSNETKETPAVPQQPIAAMDPTPAPPPVPTPVPAPPAASTSAGKKPAIPVQRQQEMSQRKLSLSELRAKYPEFFKVNGQTGVKKIALTFDDGPDQVYTPQVLDVLKANNVKATFFLVGRRAEANPSVVQRIIQEGHVIGNHSYNHPLFTKLSLADYRNQIERTSNILHAQIGYYPKLIRPPYGEITEEQLKWTGSQHYVIVNWNIDSLDWKGLSADQVARNIMSHARPGAIVLQHSAGGDKQDLSGTVSALSAIIRQIKADGYELVTVPQLLNLSQQM